VPARYWHLVGVYVFYVKITPDIQIQVFDCI